MTLEREVKLAVGPMFQVPDLTEVVPGAVAVDEGSDRFMASYYDTPDLRLARWGCALRYRTGEGWTVKLPISVSEGRLDRDERSFEAGPGRPPEGAVDLVRAYVRNAPVRLVVRLQTVRRRLGIEIDGERRIAEVVDDEVSVLDGRRVAGRFREVEVELTPDAEDGILDVIVARLDAGGVEARSDLPKFVRALQPRSVEPPDVLPGDPGRHAVVLDVIRASVARSAERMLRHDAGVRLGEDPEAVHQARVATRRLRSDLRAYRPLLDPEWVAGLREELGWLGGELGTVRDLDVLDERLRGRIRSLPDDDIDAAPKLLDRVRTERDAARMDLMSAMREPRYLSLLDRVVAAAAEPAVLPEVAGRPAAEVLGGLMEAPWRHLEQICEDLGPRSADGELHQARIRAKRVRYAAEAMLPIFGKSARRFARRAADLQMVLGEHQDAVLAIGWLRAQAGGTAARGAFVAGELAGLEHLAQSEARAAWPAAWKALRPKKYRFWEVGDE